ncbi:hypothetical protein HDU79_008663, partial [Rhizoclosmatium sp. JEL0117]
MADTELEDDDGYATPVRPRLLVPETPLARTGAFLRNVFAAYTSTPGAKMPLPSRFVAVAVTPAPLPGPLPGLVLPPPRPNFKENVATEEEDEDEEEEEATKKQVAPAAEVANNIPPIQPHPSTHSQPISSQFQSQSQPQNTFGVRVFLRLRAAAAGLPRVVTVDNNAVQFHDARFSFDAVFAESARDAEVFDAAARPLLARLVSKELQTNELLMAYGPSGSGKTHTLDRVLESTLRFLLTHASQSPAALKPLAWDDWVLSNNTDVVPGESCSIWISFLECFDLLDESGKREPQQLRYIHGNPILKTAVHVQIQDYKQALDLIRRVKSARETAETKVNKSSSRGHLITTVKVVRVTVDSKGLLVGDPKMSRMAIADLAGTENCKRTGSEGSTLTEAGKINQSLHHLSECVKTMVRIQQQQRPSSAASFSSTHSTINAGGYSQIPYRNCQLTKALFPYFRNGLVTFVFHINPTNEDQTKIALDFSQQSCQLVTYNPLERLLQKKKPGKKGDEVDVAKAYFQHQLHNLTSQTTLLQRERDEARLENQQLLELMRSSQTDEFRWKQKCAQQLEEQRIRMEKREVEVKKMHDLKVEAFEEKIDEMEQEMDQKDAEIDLKDAMCDQKDLAIQALQSDFDAEKRKVEVLEARLIQLEQMLMKKQEVLMDEALTVVGCGTCEETNQALTTKSNELDILSCKWREFEAEWVLRMSQGLERERQLEDEKQMYLTQLLSRSKTNQGTQSDSTTTIEGTTQTPKMELPEVSDACSQVDASNVVNSSTQVEAPQHLLDTRYDSAYVPHTELREVSVQVGGCSQFCETSTETTRLHFQDTETQCDCETTVEDLVQDTIDSYSVGGSAAVVTFDDSFETDAMFVPMACERSPGVDPTDFDIPAGFSVETQTEELVGGGVSVATQTMVHGVEVSQVLSEETLQALENHGSENVGINLRAAQVSVGVQTNLQNPSPSLLLQKEANINIYAPTAAGEKSGLRRKRVVRSYSETVESEEDNLNTSQDGIDDTGGDDEFAPKDGIRESA